MNKPLLLKTSALITLFGILALCSFTLLPDTFTALLNRAGINFNQPKDWVEVPIINNPHMHYDYAIKCPDKDFEARFTIRPMDTLLKQYETMNKRPGSMMLHPNKLFSGVLMATAFNISSGERQPVIKDFDSLAVNRDFNADKGAFALTYGKKEFAQAYHYCSVLAIQKNNVAYAYCFIMFNNMDDYRALAPTVYQCMKFK